MMTTITTYRASIWAVLAGLASVLVAPLPAAAQTGHVLNGISPADQAMGGAGMALPQDASGALHWNPAAITTLPSTSIGVSLQLLDPSGELASSVEAGAFGPAGPPARFSGQTTSEAGPFAIPALAFASVPEASDWAFGASVFGVGGFGVDYGAARPDQSGANPLLTPQAPNGFGFGALSSEYSLLQMAPSAAYRVSPRLSVGVAPVLNVAFLEVAPFPAAAPDDANGDGFPSYPAAPSDAAVGYGVRAGVHYAAPSGFSIGASFKSRQHFEDFAFDAESEVGGARTLTFNLDYPMILSAAIGYSGFDRLNLVFDVRYIDFENTDGFEAAGYDATGAVMGFGWQSIIVVAGGAQYRITDRLPVRLGYAFNGNPIDGDMTFFNTPSPAIIQHHLAGGLGYALSQRVHASLALQYGLANEVQGPWRLPGAGAVPGTTVQSELSTLTFVAGLDIRL